MRSEVTHTMDMSPRFFCPECKTVHDAPAEASYVLTVLCLDCDLEERRRAAAPEPRVAAAA